MIKRKKRVKTATIIVVVMVMLNTFKSTALAAAETNIDATTSEAKNFFLILLIGAFIGIGIGAILLVVGRAIDNSLVYKGTGIYVGKIGLFLLFLSVVVMVSTCCGSIILLI